MERDLMTGALALAQGVEGRTDAKMPVPWILLVDTLAGSLLLLSLSGAVLWWETKRRLRLGIAIFGVSVAVTAGLALWPLQP
jgi:uncharacterized protein